MEHYFSENQYQWNKDEKAGFLLQQLSRLSENHMQACIPYSNIIKTLYSDVEFPYRDLTTIPFLPVQLFKQIDLKSTPDTEIFKVLTSSGTTSQAVSKIYLNRETAVLQTKALVSIVTHFIGKDRLPMLIIDHPNVIKDRTSFSARGAGILGFASFGKDMTYLLNDSMEIDIEKLIQFLAKHQNKKILLFGFTFMVWQYLYQACQQKNIKLNLNQATLIHGGGWKKLADLNISNQQFKECLQQQFNLSNIHSYYGMVEQVGSIFMECATGNLHTPLFADVIIRDPITLKPLKKNKPGLIQVLSILPESYPGHSLLTEDLGTLLGEDNCLCGLKGKYFAVHGRLPKAELRGCSDTHAFS